MGSLIWGLISLNRVRRAKQDILCAMYAKFFGLKQEPFSIAPDPHYLFMSERHREALAHLLYGASGGGGFVLLTGEIGAGKTTVCRCFLEQIPKRCNVGYIFNPKLTVTELLQSVCDEFHIPAPTASNGQEGLTVKDYLDPINEFLLKTHAVGLNNILIIDEAQHLSVEVLEQLRLLTNLETNERKLLQIILIGQPELRGLLAQPELEQLAQRVIARFHLEALTERETSRYIRHRLVVAGLKGARPFGSKARQRVHQLTKGVPRRINLLCDRAMLGAYGAGKNVVDVATINKAAAEVFPSLSAPLAAALPRWQRLSGAWSLALGVVLGALLVAGIGWGVQGGWSGAPSVAPEVATPAVLAASTVVAASEPTVPASSALPASSVSVVAASQATHTTASLLRDESQAWRELSTLWGLSVADAVNPCAALAAQNVQCFKGQVTLTTIRQLGRPGILTLHDDKGKALYVLLSAMGPQSVQFSMGGVSRTLSVSALAQLWNGEFATLWRAPAAYRGPLMMGQSGEAVNALVEQLARAASQPVPVLRVRPVFDASLKSQVAAFQMAQGLKPDGVAGPTTFMQLSSVLGADEPRLQALAAESSSAASAPTKPVLP